MDTFVVVVVDILAEQASQVVFVQDDHVVEKLAAYATYDALSRFWTFSVRYDPKPMELKLSRFADYAIAARIQDTRVGLSRFGRQSSPFRTVNFLRVTSSA